MHVNAFFLQRPATHLSFLSQKLKVHELREGERISNSKQKSRPPEKSAGPKRIINSKQNQAQSPLKKTVHNPPPIKIQAPPEKNQIQAPGNPKKTMLQQRGRAAEGSAPSALADGPESPPRTPASGAVAPSAALLPGRGKKQKRHQCNEYVFSMTL